MTQIRFDENTPVMNIYSRRGDKVVFLGINGYKSEREDALKLLDAGKTYEVRKTDVYSSSTTVWLEGFSVGFNSVMFGPESVLLTPEVTKEIVTTDLDVWKAHFDKYGVRYVVESWPQPKSETGFEEICDTHVVTDEGEGYTAFEMRIVFDPQGKFKSYGVWE